MIQRIQTLFLFLAAGAAAMLFIFPIASFMSEVAFMKLSVLELKNLTPGSEPLFSPYFTLPLTVLAALSVIFPFIAIFLYKNRRVQLKLAHFNVFFLVVMTAGILLYYQNTIEKTANAQADYLSYPGIYFPLIALIFTLLSIRGIRKDEKLIKSLNRIR